MYTSLTLNYNIEPHKYLEVIRDGNEVTVLYSDDGSLITKQTHVFSIPPAKGFVKVGATRETITVETATGSWENRYELDYTTETETDEETPAETDEEASTEQENE